MFCSQCGKKVTENMLFCPFCGKPIVIPDQEPEEAESSAAPGGERMEASAQPRGGAESTRRADDAAARPDEVGRTTLNLDTMRKSGEAAARSERTIRKEAEAFSHSEHSTLTETDAFVRSDERKSDAESSRRSGEMAAPTESDDGANPALDMSLRAGRAAVHSERLTREAAEASLRSERSIRAGAEAFGRDREEAQNGAGAEGLDGLPERRESPKSMKTRRAETDAALRRGDAPSPGRGASKGLQIDWEAEKRFKPLDLDDMDPEPVQEKPDNPREELSELLSHRLREEPVRLKGRAPDLSNVHNPDRPGASSRRKASSYTPVREFNPDDIFMDGDDYDEDEDDDDEEYAYEEPEEGGFFIRHIRGVVGLSLFAIVLAIVAGWAFSGGGQRVLAQANLAWQPSVYEQLGYEAYQNGQYAVAAGYYEQALKRDGRNYSYAYSAAVASYMAGDTERAAEMGKRAVEIDASRVDGYQLLQRLYPDASARPWEIQSLIQQGYRLTGDASLNDAPQQ